MSYDTLLTQVGEFGPYHIRLYLLLSTLPLIGAFHAFNVVFNGQIPHFRCAIPSYNDSYTIQDDHHYQLVNSSVVYDEDIGQFSQCYVYSQRPPLVTGPNSSSLLQSTVATPIVQCDEWVYEPQVARASIVAEFDLVCDRKTFMKHMKMSVMLGYLIGSLLGGAACDFFGRKKIIILSCLMENLFGFIMAFSPSVTVMFGCRLLIAAFGLITFIACFIYMAEVVTPKKRVVATMGTMLGWCVGLFLADLVYYLVREWRDAQLVISVPAVLVISYIWLMPESPRWLLVHNRTAEAEVIIRKMAKVNNVQLPDDVGKLLESEDEKTEVKVQNKNQYKIWQLFTSKAMCLRVSILSFSWLTNSMVYFGLTLNIGDLIEGSIYVNYALQAFMELIAYVVCLLILERVDRKHIYCTFILMSGLSCIATAGPLIAESSFRWVDILLFSIGKLGITGSFAVIYILTAELIPTAARNSGLGFCSFIGRIGGLVSPYIGSLGEYIPNKFGQTLPLLIFGLLAIISCVTVMTLPETRNRKLPETFDDAKAQKTSSQRPKTDESSIDV